MCFLALGGLLGGLFGGGAAAAGTAAAGTAAAAAGGSSALGTLGTLAGLAGTGMQTFASYQANKYNQGVMQQQALDEIRMTRAAEEDHRRQASRVMGAQTAAMAAHGVMPGSVTALALMQDSAEDLEYDALKIRASGYNRAQGHLNSAATLAAERPGIVAGGILSAGRALLETRQRWSELS